MKYNLSNLNKLKNALNTTLSFNEIPTVNDLSNKDKIFYIANAQTAIKSAAQRLINYDLYQTAEEHDNWWKNKLTYAEKYFINKLSKINNSLRIDQNYFRKISVDISNTNDKYEDFTFCFWVHILSLNDMNIINLTSFLYPIQIYIADNKLKIKVKITEIYSMTVNTNDKIFITLTYSYSNKKLNVFINNLLTDTKVKLKNSYYLPIFNSIKLNFNSIEIGDTSSANFFIDEIKWLNEELNIADIEYLSQNKIYYNDKNLLYYRFDTKNSKYYNDIEQNTIIEYDLSPFKNNITKNCLIVYGNQPLYYLFANSSFTFNDNCNSYNIYPDSTEFTDWYNSSLEEAKTIDENNKNNIENVIPEYIFTKYSVNDNNILTNILLSSLVLNDIIVITENIKEIKNVDITKYKEIQDLKYIINKLFNNRFDKLLSSNLKEKIFIDEISKEEIINEILKRLLQTYIYVIRTKGSRLNNSLINNIVGLDDKQNLLLQYYSNTFYDINLFTEKYENDIIKRKCLNLYNSGSIYNSNVIEDKFDDSIENIFLLYLKIPKIEIINNFEELKTYEIPNYYLTSSIIKYEFMSGSSKIINHTYYTRNIDNPNNLILYSYMSSSTGETLLSSSFINNAEYYILKSRLISEDNTETIDFYHYLYDKDLNIYAEQANSIGNDIPSGSIAKHYIRIGSIYDNNNVITASDIHFIEFRHYQINRDYNIDNNKLNNILNQHIMNIDEYGFDIQDIYNSTSNWDKISLQLSPYNRFIINRSTYAIGASEDITDYGILKLLGNDPIINMKYTGSKIDSYNTLINIKKLNKNIKQSNKYNNLSNIRSINSYFESNINYFNDKNIENIISDNNVLFSQLMNNILNISTATGNSDNIKALLYNKNNKTSYLKYIYNIRNLYLILSIFEIFNNITHSITLENTILGTKMI